MNKFRLASVSLSVGFLAAALALVVHVRFGVEAAIAWFAFLMGAGAVAGGWLLRSLNDVIRQGTTHVTQVHSESMELLESRLQAVVGELESQLSDIRTGVSEDETATKQMVAQESHRMRRHLDRVYSQIESYIQLTQLLRPQAPLPGSRNWAASPDVLLELVRTILTDRPALVVEAGSGLSTVVMGHALAQIGRGRIVALEHEAEFARRTRQALSQHGLGHLAEVRHAPLAHVRLEGEERSWYAPEAIDDLRPIDLLFVDGPPETSGSLPRYPALPLLLEHLAPNATVLMDDMVRESEKKTLELWQEQIHGFESEVLQTEKGLAVLSFGAEPSGVPAHEGRRT